MKDPRYTVHLLDYNEEIEVDASDMQEAAEVGVANWQQETCDWNETCFNVRVEQGDLSECFSVKVAMVPQYYAWKEKK